MHWPPTCYVIVLFISQYSMYRGTMIFFVTDVLQMVSKHYFYFYFTSFREQNENNHFFNKRSPGIQQMFNITGVLVFFRTT